MPVQANLKHRGFYSHRSLLYSAVFYLTIILTSFTVSLAPRDAVAAPPDISGSYTGNLSGSGICTPPPNETANTNLTFTITQNGGNFTGRSEEHTSELQSRLHLVWRLLLGQ